MREFKKYRYLFTILLLLFTASVHPQASIPATFKDEDPLKDHQYIVKKRKK